ncbi:MAG: hypothetical protein ACLFTT_05870 [Candidatus Hydrogenedentota bacterium]
MNDVENTPAEDAAEPAGDDAGAAVASGAYEAVLCIAGLAFCGLVGFVFAFGLWGENVVAGLDEACSEAVFATANELRAEGHTELAIQRFRVAYEGHFRDEETRYMCGRALGDLLTQEGRYDEAIEVYRSLPAAAFANAGAYAGYVDALYRQGNDGAAQRMGEEWLAKAEAQGAEEQIEWANGILFYLARKRGDAQQAIAHAQAAIEVNPASDMGFHLARLLYARGEARAARARLAHFIEATEKTNLRLKAERLQTQWANASASAAR